MEIINLFYSLFVLWNFLFISLENITFYLAGVYLFSSKSNILHVKQV